MGRTNLMDVSMSDYKIEDFPRLRELRDKQLSLKSEVCIERASLITEYLTKYDDPNDPEIVRRAKSIKYFLSNKKPIIFDNNVLAGTTTSKQLGAPVYPEFIGLTIWPELETISSREKNPQHITKKEIDKLNYEVFPYWIDKSVLEVARKQKHNETAMKLLERMNFFIAGKVGFISHTVPCYQKILKRGLNDIMKEASEKKRLMQTKDVDKYNFYKAVEISLQGVLNYTGNLFKLAIEMSKKEQDPAKKRMYDKMARVCARVPAEPATSFLEAVNSLWICHIAVHGENMNMAISPGRLDQILYDYFKKDMSENNITEKEAIDIVGCLWLKLSDNVNLLPELSEELFGGASTAQSVTLGGIDNNGNDSVNELTYVMLKVTELLKTNEPNLIARYNHEKNSVDYRNRVCEVMANTKAITSFHNDVENIRTLSNQGVSFEHARDYSVIGCAELAESGRGYQAAGAIMINIVTPLLLTLYNGFLPTGDNKLISIETVAMSEITKFGELFEEYKKQLSWLISQAVSINEHLGGVHQQILPTPLLSAMFSGPLENGQDLIFGGALYNSSGVSHIGFVDAVDSLCAIYDTVFVKKKWSLEFVIKAMEANFEGEYSEVSAYVLNKSPRYKQSDGVSQKIAGELVDFLYQEYNTYTNYRGGKYRPNVWSMTSHAGLGKISGALPNGRKMGMPFSRGIKPVLCASNNLNDCVTAVSKLGRHNFHIGETLHINIGSEDGCENSSKLGDMVESYSKLGVQQVQVNSLAYEILKDELIPREQFDVENGQYIFAKI